MTQGGDGVGIKLARDSNELRRLILTTHDLNHLMCTTVLLRYDDSIFEDRVLPRRDVTVCQ